MVLYGGDFSKGEKYYGVYVGVVIDVDDEEDWGRIKVRVDEIYGSSEGTPDDVLPWAFEVQNFGGCYDSGSRTPYLKGSTVLVVFEGGHAMHPIVLGGICKRPSLDWKYGGPISSVDESWSPLNDDTEIPREVIGDNNRKYVLFKTPKGASILINEADGEEYLRIVDRAGQVIEMRSPVIPSGDGVPRGEKNKIDSDALDYASMLPPSSIRVIDLAGQEILMSSAPGQELVSIMSKGRDGVKEQKIILDSSSGNENILLRDSSGQMFKLSAADNQIILTSVGNYIENIGLAHVKQVGTSMNLSAGTSMNLSAGTDMTISSGGIFNLFSGGILNLSSTGIVTIQALATLVLSTVGLLTFGSGAALLITAVGILSLLASVVILGVAGSEQALCNRAMMDLYNTHTHQYTAPVHAGGPVPTGVPDQPASDGTHTTVNVKGS